MRKNKFSPRMSKIVPKRDSVQYLMRLPPGMRERLTAKAEESGRSINTEIVMAIEEALAKPTRIDQLEQRIAALEQRHGQYQDRQEHLNTGLAASPWRGR